MYCRVITWHNICRVIVQACLSCYKFKIFFMLPCRVGIKTLCGSDTIKILNFHVLLNLLTRTIEHTNGHTYWNVYERPWRGHDGGLKSRPSWLNLSPLTLPFLHSSLPLLLLHLHFSLKSRLYKLERHFSTLLPAGAFFSRKYWLHHRSLHSRSSPFVFFLRLQLLSASWSDMGRAPCCDKVGLKRGRWTTEEDDILTRYIQANGEGCWRALPKNAGAGHFRDSIAAYIFENYKTW